MPYSINLTFYTVDLATLQKWDIDKGLNGCAAHLKERQLVVTLLIITHSCLHFFTNTEQGTVHTAVKVTVHVSDVLIHIPLDHFPRSYL